MKKGFLHLIEIIIISMVMFVIIYQFSYIPPLPTEFDRSKLMLMGNDILFTLEKKGVNWFDKGQLINELDAYFSGTSVVYDIMLKNALKTPFSVGCICSPDEMSSLQSQLKPFTLNGQQIEFVVNRIEPPLPENCNSFTGSLPLVYDAIVSYDYNFSGDLGCQAYDYADDLKGYLKDGKGFVQIRDLSYDKLSGTDAQIYKNFFGVELGQSAPDPFKEIRFTTTINTTFYPIEKYFSSFPFYFENFDDGVADSWVPIVNSIWNVMNLSGKMVYNGSVLAANNAGFNNLSIAYPENYTVQFDFNVSTGRSAFWAISYSDQSQFIMVGAAIPSAGTGKLVIANESVFFNIGGIRAYAVNSSFNLKKGEWYNIKITRQKDLISAVLTNSTGATEEVSYNFAAAGIPIPSGNAGFVLLNKSDWTQYDNIRLTLPHPFSFKNFLKSNETVNVSSSLGVEHMLLRQENGIPAAMVNSNIKDAQNRGRTAWLSAGAANPENGVLIRSLVAWAAGENYHILPATVPNPVVVSLIKTLNADMFQPLEIVMDIGFVF